MALMIPPNGSSWQRWATAHNTSHPLQAVLPPQTGSPLPARSKSYLPANRIAGPNRATSRFMISTNSPRAVGG